MVKRKCVGSPLNVELYKRLKLLAVQKDVPVNILLEEGMQHILSKYEKEETAAGS